MRAFLPCTSAIAALKLVSQRLSLLLLFGHVGAQEAAADDGAASAGRALRCEELVVVRQLLALGDVPHSEDADARVAVHRPALQLAVGVAAVVDETGVVGLQKKRCVKSG